MNPLQIASMIGAAGLGIAAMSFFSMYISATKIIKRKDKTIHDLEKKEAKFNNLEKENEQLKKDCHLTTA